MIIAPSTKPLGDVMEKRKFPRTYHLPWSGGASDAGERVMDPSILYGKEVVITEKVDGENTTFARDYLHARSLDWAYHPSRTWVANLWGSVSPNIHPDVRVCGENLYAKHSVEYTDLPSYFLVYAVMFDDIVLSWKDTERMCFELGLRHVHVCHWSVYDAVSESCLKEKKCDEMGSAYGEVSEGYVLRPSDSFHIEDWKTLVGKYVRPNHVQTDIHWMTNSIEKNKLAKMPP
jgi:hypothetical protein